MHNNTTPGTKVETLTKIAGEFTQQSLDEQERHMQLFSIAQALLPQYGHQWNIHNLVTLKRQSLSRILYYNNLYQKIVDVPGVICEFGVQWGATLAQLINLRGMYEPFNHSRKIFGFDTFEGFSVVDSKDGDFSKVGDYATTEKYEETLDKLLTLHESFSPIPHVKKFELIKGDASITIDGWLTNNPHAIVAMAIFDMDVYKPTKDVLEKILPRLTKGSLLVFDELNCPHFPGETLAVNEVLGLNNLSLKRFAHQPYSAWAVFGE
ncbi:TylF/MycF/NovP-related O-methyltransferase [Arsenicibacter rosenii]|uniref:Crotonobetainyl-CoA--carnitine CoA-transferase n=1 Tax=Arsenicibacter rosenii TaxID=1750698 RepID=A0A1S2VCG0_9BACT|nr:TylF/MycF/NovP-related O-methyltransferase [Arsenicibacter rosenii]OIN56369.1 crotonobetainyl-CoA--carnitine CoA-transferase [Arsenicibacter rosenii]